MDKIQVTPEKGKDWEYASPSVITIFNKNKKGGSFGFPTCQDMARAFVEHLPKEDNDAISKIELSKAGNGDDAKCGFFLNIFLKNEFIEE